MRINCKKTLLAGALAASLAALNAQAGLTHRYSFTANAKDSIDTSGKSDGTPVNGVTFETGFAHDVYAGAAQGAHLNNYNNGAVPSSTTTGQYITLPTNVIAGATSLTFESWTDLGDSTFSSQTWARIFDIGDPTYSVGSGHNFLTLEPYTGSTDSRLEFNINGNGQNAEGPANSVLTGYHHVMAIVNCDTGYLEYYVDGVLQAHNTTTYQVSNIVNKVFWLGRSEYSGDAFMYGYIDEFRIYNTALSALDAAASYANGPDVIASTATTLGAVQALYISDPGHILELHGGSTVVTGDFANSNLVTLAQFTGLRMFNAVGFTLTSSDTNIATIDAQGNIKGLKPGTSTLTAKYGSKTTTFTLTVDADTTAPTVTKIDNIGYDKLIQVTFSKPVDPVTAQMAGNYSIDQGVTVSRAVLSTNGLVVTLYTSQFNNNGSYTLTINGVQDTVFTPNVMQAATGQFGTGLGTAAGAVGDPMPRHLYFTTAGFTTDTLANGMKSAGYPYQGGTVKMMANGLVDGGGYGDNYFSSVSGWLWPTTTDTYHFGLACDDDAAVYFSPTDSEADLPASPTYQAVGWSGVGKFTGNSESYSGANSVNVVAGNRYFFRVVMRNGTGGDNFGVTWTNIATPIVDNMPYIPASELQPCFASETKVMTIISQPADVQIGQNNDATFSVAVSSLPTYTGVQWYKANTNGTVTQIMTNGNSLTYTAPLVSTNDSGAMYYAVVSNLIDVVTTRQAVLTVSVDNIPPQLVSAIVNAVVGPAATNITVSFSERVGAATAGVKGNYTIGGLTVASATYDTNNLTNVYLTVTAPMTAGAAYTLTVKNVKDLAGNVIDPAYKSVVFHAAQLVSPGNFIIRVYDNNTAGPDAIVATAASSSPSRTLAYPDMQTDNAEHGDNFAGIAQGLLVAPETGNYVFDICSDDGSRFWLSTDATAANLSAAPIMGINGWCSSWGTFGSDTTPGGTYPQKSATIALVKGSQYYYQCTWNEGGGGDYVNVGWELPSNPGVIQIIPGSALLTPATVDLSSITITTNPVSMTTTESVPVTFTAAATGTSQYGAAPTAQWFENGVAIPGATGNSYTTASPGPFFAKDNNAKFTCVFTEPLLSKTTTVAVLTITSQLTKPMVLLSAGAFSGSTSVGVRFGNYVDPVSGLAIKNYTIPGYTVSAATIRTNANLDYKNGDMVELTVAPAIADGAVLTVKNVVDIYGNTLASGTVNVGIPDMQAQDVVNANGPTLDPQFLGITEPSGSNSFRIQAGGSDIWGTGDCFQFVYKSFNGDFDLRARVANIQGVNGWSKAGVMARDTLDTNSVMFYQVSTANSGQNTWAAGMRTTTGGSAADLPYAPGVTAYPPNPTYPNSWVRLTRLGQVITSWYSTNGTSWTKSASNDVSAVTPAINETLLVGIAVTGHDNGGTHTVTDVYDFSVTTYTGELLTVPALMAGFSGADVLISWDSVAGAGCTLLASDDLVTWAPAGLTVNDDGVTASVTITPTDKKFYQLSR